MSEIPLPEPGDEEMLVRAIYLDVAPYMRARISPQKNYAAGVGQGDVMLGGAIGEVVHSNIPDYKPGDFVVSDTTFGWQDFGVLSPSVVRRIDTDIAPLPCWLDFMGLNGLTAYTGLVDAGQIKPGDTVLISAAAGSVGQIAGQIAQLAGSRAIAATSSEEKIAQYRELGYDAGINYRTEPDLAAAVGRVCLEGVDVFFDNTAGPIHDAVLHNLAMHSRIIVCGTVRLADIVQPCPYPGILSLRLSAPVPRGADTPGQLASKWQSQVSIRYRRRAGEHSKRVFASPDQQELGKTTVAGWRRSPREHLRFTARRFSRHPRRDGAVISVG